MTRFPSAARSGEIALPWNGAECVVFMSRRQGRICDVAAAPIGVCWRAAPPCPALVFAPRRPGPAVGAGPRAGRVARHATPWGALLRGPGTARPRPTRRLTRRRPGSRSWSGPTPSADCFDTPFPRAAVECSCFACCVCLRQRRSRAGVCACVFPYGNSSSCVPVCALVLVCVCVRAHTRKKRY